MARWLITVLLLLGVAGDVTAQRPSCVMPREDLVSPLIRAVVSSSAGGFDYQYAVTNRADAQQTLISFAVEVLTVPPPVQTSPPAWEGVGPILPAGVVHVNGVRAVNRGEKKVAA
jgi:hypothetical protein